MITPILICVVFVPVFLTAFFVLRNYSLLPRILLIASGFHLIALMLIYRHFGLSSSDMNIVAAWKELLVLSAMFWLILFSTQKGTIWKPKLNIVDKMVLIYLLLNICYIPFSFSFREMPISVPAILNGFRIQTMMPITYLAARIAAIHSERDQKKLLHTIVTFGTFISLIGILELFVNPSSFLNSMGMKNYLMSVGGMGENEFSPDGLVATYYSAYNTLDGYGQSFRRAGSTLLSPLTFGQVLLVTVPVALFLSLKGGVSRFHLVAQLLGAISSLSRGPIAAMLLALVAVTLLTKVFSNRVKLGILVCTFIVAVGICYKASDFITATISLRDSSSAIRVAVWVNSFYFALQHPLGVGLAASSTKFMGSSVIGGGESELFENVSRIGWLGLTIYLLMQIVIIRVSTKARFPRDSMAQMLCSIVFAITVGLLAQSFVNKIWNSPFLPYAYGWILGMWSSYVPSKKLSSIRACSN